MFLHSFDLTTALRPSLLPDESLLFVQDAVGLYDGKLKIPEYQNGQAYLTSHRACYIDHEDARNKAVAVDLKDVDRCELYVRVKQHKIEIHETDMIDSLAGRILKVVAQSHTSS